MENIDDAIIKFLLNNGLTVSAMIAAFIVACLRTAKQNGKTDWIESLLCSAITLGLSSLLEYFGLNQNASIFIGVFVGYLGTKQISDMVLERLFGKSEKK